MALLLRRKYGWKNFNMPVSYRALAQDKMNDSSNVFTNQKVLETRNAVVRWNTNALPNGEDVQSLSYFESNSGDKSVLAKAGNTIYKASETASSTVLNASLSTTTKHRAVSFNSRHIICLGSDGLFQYDGTDFGQLGQASGSAPSIAASGAGNTLPAGTYKVAYTYYDSAVGFESNLSEESSGQAVTLGQQLDVSGLPATAANPFIDKLRIYLNDTTSPGDFFFFSEIDLGTTTATIGENTNSAITPPENNSPPLNGGGLYPVLFNNRFVYAGNSTFESDVFFSQPFDPNSFDLSSSSKTINTSGSGPITGLGVGFYNNDNLSPFLVVFKRSSIEIYSELRDIPAQQIISSEVGCVSHDTIQVINGDVYFLSSQGWLVVSNGMLYKKDGEPYYLGDGDINDIFTRSGFVFEVNKSNFNNFFSVFYPTLNHYLTFVSEGVGTNINRAYNYELRLKGFRPYNFSVNLTCAALTVDSSGEDVVLFGGSNGKIYKHSIKTGLIDIDETGENVAINPFVLLYWISGDDMDATYNFGDFAIRAFVQDAPIKATYFLNYDRSIFDSRTLDVSGNTTGFILDVSKLDEAPLGDDRTIKTARNGIYRTGESLLIYLFQDTINTNINLIEGQLDVSKNENPAN